MGRKITARLLPLFGFLFLTAYLRSAALNVVYTDYIRLVNTYLPDVRSVVPYLHGDILTRIPINYPERILNVMLFHYSTMFDMMLGALGLAVSAWIAGSYCLRRGISAGITAALMLFIFSLNKWEMLTNGSGWVHFAAFALFWYHYLVYDRVLAGEAKRGDGKRLYLLPWIIILFFAGPYCGVYAVTMLLADAFLIYRQLRASEKRESCAAVVGRMLCTALPLGLYLISRTMSVEERAGATTKPFLTILMEKPLLLPSFFVRSLSSGIIGGETAAEYGIFGWQMTALGLFILGCYAAAFFVNFRRRLYEKSTFPLLLLTSGFLNHVLVTLSRWIFLDESYGMSSRYALQFQVGIAGILLSLVIAEKVKRTEMKSTDAAAADRGSSEENDEENDRKNGRKNSRVRKIPAEQQSVIRYRRAVLLFAALVTAGNLLTTAREIHMAPYRQEHFLKMRETALDFRNQSDEALKQVFRYHDPGRIRKALALLEERRLNVYYE
ncbi:MAG: hypothetical protein ACTTK0_00370 [Stomatobaculum sp.]